MSGINAAGEFLRRMAPAQSHDNRRAFLDAAKFLDGLNIHSGPVAFIIPIYHQEKFLGHISILAQLDFCGDDVLLTTEFWKWDGSVSRFTDG